MLDINELNQIALKIINQSINEWGLEDEKAYVNFVSGVLQFLTEINKKLDRVIKEGVNENN